MPRPTYSSMWRAGRASGDGSSPIASCRWERIIRGRYVSLRTEVCIQGERDLRASAEREHLRYLQEADLGCPDLRVSLKPREQV